MISFIRWFPLAYRVGTILNVFPESKIVIGPGYILIFSQSSSEWKPYLKYGARITPLMWIVMAMFSLCDKTIAPPYWLPGVLTFWLSLMFAIRFLFNRCEWRQFPFLSSPMSYMCKLNVMETFPIASSGTVIVIASPGGMKIGPARFQ